MDVLVVWGREKENEMLGKNKKWLNRTVRREPIGSSGSWSDLQFKWSDSNSIAFWSNWPDLTETVIEIVIGWQSGPTRFDF